MKAFRWLQAAVLLIGQAGVAETSAAPECDTRIDRGEQLLRSGRPAEARAPLLAALAESPRGSRCESWSVERLVSVCFSSQLDQSARLACDEAVIEAGSRHGTADHLLARFMVDVAQHAVREGRDLGHARELLDRAIAAAGSGPDVPYLWEVREPLDLLAAAYAKEGATDAARDIYEERLALERRNGNAGSFDTYFTVHRLAGLLQGIGEYGAAAEQYERELRDTEARCGAGSKDASRVADNYVEALERAGDRDRADVLRRRTDPQRAHPETREPRDPYCRPAPDKPEPDATSAQKFMNPGLSQR